MGESFFLLAVIREAQPSWAILLGAPPHRSRLRLCLVVQPNVGEAAAGCNNAQNADKMTFRQRYSHYLPLKRSSRAASRSASLNKDGPRSPPKEKEGRESRSGRASSSSQTSKRRSTMNSREAGYDEAEALRRAIEASKEDAPLEPGDGGSRRAKRVRSDSEEYGAATPVCRDDC
jgi:hypothetical protein